MNKNKTVQVLIQNVGEYFDKFGVRRAAAATGAAKSLQSCSTLYDPIDGSLPGSPVLGILQARILEWVSVPFYRELPSPGIKPGSPVLQADHYH